MELLECRIELRAERAKNQPLNSTAELPNSKQHTESLTHSEIVNLIKSTLADFMKPYLQHLSKASFTNSITHHTKQNKINKSKKFTKWSITISHAGIRTVHTTTNLANSMENISSKPSQTMETDNSISSQQES